MCPTSGWASSQILYIHVRLGQTKGNTVHSFIAFGIFNAMSEAAVRPKVNLSMLDVGCGIAFSWVYCFPTRSRTNIKRAESYKTLAHINHFSLGSDAPCVQKSIYSLMSCSRRCRCRCSGERNSIKLFDVTIACCIPGSIPGISCASPIPQFVLGSENCQNIDSGIRYAFCPN